MSAAHAVIHGEHTGDWAVIEQGGRLGLYPPGTWHDHVGVPGRPGGLSWSPKCGIDLPWHPRLAWWKARRIVAKRERAVRRAEATRNRARNFITARSKEPR